MTFFSRCESAWPLLLVHAQEPLKCFDKGPAHFTAILTQFYVIRPIWLDPGSFVFSKTVRRIYRKPVRRQAAVLCPLISASRLPVHSHRPPGTWGQNYWLRFQSGFFHLFYADNYCLFCLFPDHVLQPLVRLNRKQKCRRLAGHARNALFAQDIKIFPESPAPRKPLTLLDSIHAVPDDLVTFSSLP